MGKVLYDIMSSLEKFNIKLVGRLGGSATIKLQKTHL